MARAFLQEWAEECNRCQPQGEKRNFKISEHRRHGLGRRLVEEAIALARGHFDRLRLRGEDAGPARLYESLGFRRCRDIPDCTHIMELAENSASAI
jgi:GNAT superfamily N-acetyltransferase